MHFSRVFGLALLPLISAYKLYTHDDAFVPDAILRVTAVNVSLGCIDRYSVLVNGTSPGPELRFREGEVKWVRVYNDMENYNLTMHWHGLSQAAYPFSDGMSSCSFLCNMTNRSQEPHKLHNGLSLQNTSSITN